MKNWIIIYDIRDVRRLRRIAKIMEQYALRVQKSVFEMIATRSDMLELRNLVQREMAVEDSVIWFDVCHKCWAKQYGYGSGSVKSILHDEAWHIL